MTEEEKKELDNLIYTLHIHHIDTSILFKMKDTIQKQQEEIEKLKNVLDDRFIYVTGARTVYGRLMSLDKEIIVKDDLKLRNEIQQHINKLDNKDEIIDEISKNSYNELKVNGILFTGTDIKQYFESKV